MSMIQPAVITPVLAAGSTTSPYYFQINITQRLCSSSCSDLTPVFNPQFTLVSTSNVGTNMYMCTIHCEGAITYVPCGGCSCNCKTQIVSQDFSIPFASTAAPTSVSISKNGNSVNGIATSGCQNCSRTFVSETPLTLTVA